MGFLVLTMLLLFTRQGQSDWVYGYGPVTYEMSDSVCEGSQDMITSAEECENAAIALGITFNPCCQDIDNEPYGCTFRVPDNDILFNGKITMETILLRGDKDNRQEVCSKPVSDCVDGHDWCNMLSPSNCIEFAAMGWTAPAECCVCEIFYPDNRRELNKVYPTRYQGRRELNKKIDKKKGGQRGFNEQGRRELQNYYKPGSCYLDCDQVQGGYAEDFFCGKKSQDGCWCDQECYYWQDCCEDVAEHCDIHPPNGRRELNEGKLELNNKKKGGQRGGFNDGTDGRRELKKNEKKGGQRGFNKQGRRELQDYYKPGSCYIDCDQVEGGYAPDFFCGKKSQDGCWCDDACYYYQDCCQDVAEHCDIHPPNGRRELQDTRFPRLPRLLTQFDL